MPKKRSSFRQKAREIFHPNSASAPSLPEMDDLSAEEMARLEREQEEEDLAEFRRQEEEAKAAQEAAEKSAGTEAEAAEAGSLDGEGGKKKSSKDRFKEREARKMAALAAAQPVIDEEDDARKTAEIQAERDSLMATCDALGLEVMEISPDGHCLYAAIADQLTVLGILPPNQNTYMTTREAAADYIASHPDDFLPFLPSISGEDGVGAEDDGMMTPEGLIAYTKNIKETGEWGGEPEILALSRAFKIPIHIVQLGPPSIVVHSPNPNDKGFTTVEESAATRAARITFHTRMYGLGAHYNSLRQPEAGVRNTFWQD